MRPVFHARPKYACGIRHILYAAQTNRVSSAEPQLEWPRYGGGVVFLIGRSGFRMLARVGGAPPTGRKCLVDGLSANMALPHPDTGLISNQCDEDVFRPTHRLPIYALATFWIIAISMRKGGYDYGASWVGRIINLATAVLCLSCCRAFSCVRPPHRPIETCCVTSATAAARQPRAAQLFMPGGSSSRR